MAAGKMSLGVFDGRVENLCVSDPERVTVNYQPADGPFQNISLDAIRLAADLLRQNGSDMDQAIRSLSARGHRAASRLLAEVYGDFSSAAGVVECTAELLAVLR